MEENGSPGMIGIVSHQVLCHPSEHGTSSMGKHLLAKWHISKLNKFTESEVTAVSSLTVNDTALVILTWQGSRGITIVSLPSKFIYITCRLYLYSLKWQTKCSKLAARDFKTAKFHQNTSNRYLMLGFDSADIPWDAIANLELWRSYKALWSVLVLPSASTLSNICLREYTLTVDAINKQLPSRNKGSWALDGWTLMNKLDITWVSATYRDWIWAMWEVPSAFDEVDSQIFQYFESWLRMIGQRSTYWSTACCTFGRSSGLFWAYQEPFTWND